MKIHLKDNMAFLWGDWTAAEMTYRTIDSLTNLLDQIQASGKKKLEINCAHLKSIDDSGAQFFSVWLNCLNLRDVEYELVDTTDTPDILCSRDKSSRLERIFLVSQRKTRRKPGETRRDQGYRQSETH